MANQPTKYRKFVVGAASAALVASAVAPVVSAAEFSDVSAGNSHKASIDALVAKGVISGYPDGSFQPNKTLTRSDVVKMMGKWLKAEGYAVPTDYKTNPRFADLTSASNDELLQYAALVKDNGLFIGTPDGKLDPAGNITRENMAIVVVRAFDRVHDIDLATYVAAQDFNKDVTDRASAKAEARPAIDVLDYFDITNPEAPQFNPKGTTTRAQFASFLNKAIETDYSEVGSGVVGTANVKAVNATTVEVTFKDAVENINSLNFTIEGLTVSNAAVKQTDNKTVVLTTAVQKGGEKYTVSLNNTEIGSFEGISAVVPTKIDITNQNVQGKVGQQAIVSADVGVKQAGIPVTFNVKANTVDTLNKDQVFEAVTNADGIATLSYTQYAAGVDEVVAYPTGAPTVRDYATVHWGVDSILTLEEDDKKGASLNNGENKKYKVTYKDPKTGKAVANQDIHVTFAENVDVAINKITDATINGKTAYQTTNGNVEYVTVRTDSKGEATFTVSGTNTKATPVVFIDNSGYGKNSVDKLDRTELQVKAAELTFGAVQVKYDLEVTRDGSEEAAVGSRNGRVYKVAVKDENGKAAAGEVVNVAFDEDLDRVISTNTKANFVIDNDEYKGNTVSNTTVQGRGITQIELTLDSKGEGEFKIVSSDSKDYATPVIWIDVNSASNKQGLLEDGEPKKVAEMTYFADEKIAGSKLKVYNVQTGAEIKDNRTIEGTDVAEFRFNVANQSNEEISTNARFDVRDFKATYQVTNTGTKDVYVWKNKADAGDKSKADYTISTRRGETITLDRVDANQVELYIGSDGQTASVDVTAYGEATEFYSTNNRDNKVVRLAESKVAKASFKATNEVGNSAQGTIVEFDKDKKKFKFDGKKEVSYKEEFDANKVRYYDQRSGKNVEIGAAQFEDLIDANKSANTVQYFKNSNGEITFTILAIGAGSDDGSSAAQVAAKVNAAATLDAVKTALSELQQYNALTDAGKDQAAANIFAALTDGTTYTAASLVAALNVEITVNSAVYTADVEADAGETAKAEVKDENGDVLFTIEADAVGTALNGVKVVFAQAVGNTQPTTATVGLNNTITVTLGTDASGDLNATYAQVVSAIEGALAGTTVTVEATAGTDVSEDVVGQEVELTGGEAEILPGDATLTLTFSEAVKLPANAEITIDGTVATTTNPVVNGTTATFTFTTAPTTAPTSVDKLEIDNTDKVLKLPVTITTN